MGKVKILIVEDEQRLADILKKQLGEAGFNPDVAFDGYIGKKLINSNNYDLIILDINIPLINGYDLCKEIRSTNNKIPIIMLTAFGTHENKISGFELGADDYMVKPFDFRELLARINVLIRRTSSDNTITQKIGIADLEMNLTNKTVKRNNIKIELTAKESLLLEVFLKNQNKLLTREFILENVWGFGFDPGSNIIDVYVNYLRNKIDKDFSQKLIHTKFGFGFYCSDREL